MQVSLLELLAPLVLLCNALQHHIRSLRFIESDHLNSCSVFQLDHFGEQGLADLAFELAEVVRDCDPVELALHLTIDPILQASRVHELACALTVAWAD